MESSQCGCTCNCPVFLSIDDEIRMLENHKKIMQEQIEAIDRKVAALKSVK
jgi:predicted metal-dependent hydrolase